MNLQLHQTISRFALFLWNRSSSWKRKIWKTRRTLETSGCISCLFFMPAIILPVSGIMWRDVLWQCFAAVFVLSLLHKVSGSLTCNFKFHKFKAEDPYEKIHNLKNVKVIKGSKDFQLSVWSSIFWWYYAEYRWRLWVKVMRIHSFHMLS